MGGSILFTGHFMESQQCGNDTAQQSVWVSRTLESGGAIKTSEADSVVGVCLVLIKKSASQHSGFTPHFHDGIVQRKQRQRNACPTG